MATEEIKANIRLFISRFFRDFSLKDDEDIFALGFVNSLFAMQLVLFVEKEFDLKVESDDLELDNFKTVNAIAHFIRRKTDSLTAE